MSPIICRSWLRIRLTILSIRSVSLSVRVPYFSSFYFVKLRVEDEMDVSPLNLGMIAAYYNISCTSQFLLDCQLLTIIIRHHHGSVHAFAKGTHEAQRFA